MLGCMSQTAKGGKGAKGDFQRISDPQRPGGGLPHPVPGRALGAQVLTVNIAPCILFLDRSALQNTAGFCAVRRLRGGCGRRFIRGCSGL